MKYHDVIIHPEKNGCIYFLLALAISCAIRVDRWLIDPNRTRFSAEKLAEERSTLIDDYVQTNDAQFKPS